MAVTYWSLIIMILAEWGYGFSCPLFCKCSTVKSRVSESNTSQRVVCSRDLLAAGPLKSLNSLNMGTLPTDTIYLVLRGNELTVIHRAAFATLPGLLKLDLSMNQINELQDGAFLNLTLLEKLDLSHNKLASLSNEVFFGMIALQRLDLSQNKLASLFSETFVHLVELQRLNLADNPLICDCQLMWLVELISAKHIRLTQETVCQFPTPLKGKSLVHIPKKDIHCNWPVQFPFFEIKPHSDQLTFEGDPLTFQCEVSNIEHDSQLVWMCNGHAVNSDPLGIVVIETQPSSDGSTLISSLLIKHLHSDHSGVWMCYIETPRGNESRSINLVVIAENSYHCSQTTTSGNKGEYVWPETLTGITVELECVGTSPGGLNYYDTHAYHTCTSQGVWKNLDTSLCPYISEVTNVLEQFAKTNLSLSKANVLDSARGLRNYTGSASILRDKMDVVFISHTLKNYVRFVQHYKEVAEILVDIINTVMTVDRRILWAAQEEDNACSRLVWVMEQLPELLSEGTLNHFRDNLVVEEFFVKSEGFPGMTCLSVRKDILMDNKLDKSWRGMNDINDDKILHCKMANVSKLDPSSRDKMIEAYIHLPSTLLQHPDLKGPSHKLQFIIYHSSALFPPSLEKVESFEVSSSVISSKISNITFQNLTDPVIVSLRSPAYTRDIQPVWWNQLASDGQGDWSSEGCEILSVQNNLVTFSCNHLSSFGLLQDSAALLHQYDLQRAQFRPCHPAIYVGSFICITGLAPAVFIYCYCFSNLKMPKRTKHSLINTWLSMTVLCLIFSVGVHQTDIVSLCQGVGLLLHYLSLCTLLWMIITASNLYKKLTKADPQDPPSEEVAPDHTLPPKPMLRFYLIGWGVSTIVCGISAAVHLENYGGSTYCFLSFSPSLAVFYGPAAILVLFLCIFYTLINYVLCSNSSAEGLRLSENLPITENVVMELTQPCASLSCSQHDSTVSLDDTECSHQSQLRAHATLLLLFLFTWASAAFATGRSFVNQVLGDELMFSLLYCLFSSLTGAFVFFFFCYSRKDVHHCFITWLNKKNTNVLEESDVQESITMAIETETRAHSTQSLHSSVKNKLSFPPQAGNKGANPNFLPPGSTDQSFSGAEIFYDPRQSVVARRFFEKNRRQQQMRQLQKNNLEKVAAAKTETMEVNNTKSKPFLNTVERTESSHNSFSGGEKDNEGYLKCNSQSCQTHKWNRCSSLSRLHSDIKHNPSSMTHFPPKGSHHYQKSSCMELMNSNHPPVTTHSHSCCSDLTDISHSRHRPRSRHRSRKRQHSWDGRYRSSGKHRISLHKDKIPPHSIKASKFVSGTVECPIPRSQSAYEQTLSKNHIDNLYSCSVSDHSGECSGRQHQEVCM